MTKLAILIGINNYDEYRPLNYCVQDVEQIRGILLDKARGGYEEAYVKTLTDNAEEPNKENIEDAIESARGLFPDDELFFYFSGHGDTEAGKAYLVPKGGRPSRPSTSCIELAKVRSELRDCKAKTKVLIFDACHSGPDMGKAGSKPMGKEFEQEFEISKAEGLVVISSCKTDEVSREFEELKHGAFSYFMAEGLMGNAEGDGDFVVSHDELYNYVGKKLAEWGVKTGKFQTPVLFSETLRKLPLTNVPHPVKPSAAGSTKITSIRLFKFSPAWEFKEYGPELAIDKAASDMKGNIGRLGAILAGIYTVDNVKGDGKEYTFPDGKYVAYPVESEEEEYASSTIQVDFDPTVKDEILTKVAATWGADEIDFSAEGPLPLDVAYKALERLECEIDGYEPGKRIKAHDRGIQPVVVEISNRATDSNISIKLSKYFEKAKISSSLGGSRIIGVLTGAE